MRLLPLSLLALCIGCAGQNPPVTAYAQCSAVSATQTTAKAIAEDKETWRGRCVSVQGVFGHGRFFDDADAFTAFDQTENDGSIAFLNMQYWKPRDRQNFMQAISFTEEQEEAGQSVPLRIIGVAGYCSDEHEAIARRQRATPNSIILSSSQCHFSGGPKLNPVRMDRRAD